jgi:hypothetical protein
MIPTREELALAVAAAEWGWLRAHLERGGLIVVAQDLDIVDVGLSIAADDTAAISNWIARGQLAKPSAGEIAVWDGNKEQQFLALIVSPYVLMQENSGNLQ